SSIHPEKSSSAKPIHPEHSSTLLPDLSTQAQQEIELTTQSEIEPELGHTTHEPRTSYHGDITTHKDDHTHEPTEEISVHPIPANTQSPVIVQEEAHTIQNTQLPDLSTSIHSEHEMHSSPQPEASTHSEVIAESHGDYSSTAGIPEHPWSTAQ